VRISPDVAGDAAPEALHSLRTDVAYWHLSDIAASANVRLCPETDINSRRSPNIAIGYSEQ